MPHDRFYTPSSLSTESPIELADMEFHHLKVMRVKEGDVVELVNGLNQIAEGKIAKIQKNSATIEVLNAQTVPNTTPKIILVQGMARPAHLDFILEKGTELGASEFWLFAADRSEKQELSDNQQKRFSQLMISAMKQCGRLDLPKLLVKPPLAKWPVPEGTLLFGDIRKEACSLLQKLKEVPQKEPYYMFIGPEKGFSQQEVELLEKNFKAAPVKLHTNILRTETASIAALSILYQHLIK